MNLRSLFSAAAVVASLVVPSIASAQKIPNAVPVQAQPVYAQRQAPAFGRGPQMFRGGPDVLRMIEARRNEEMRRAQMARGAERFQRAEDGRRGEAGRHGEGAPESCDHGRGGERGQSVGPQREFGRGEQRGFGRGGRR